MTMGILSSIKNGATHLIFLAQRHSKELLVVAELGSLLGAVYSGISVTPKVTRMVDEENKTRKENGQDPLTPGRVVANYGKYYIPTIGFVVVCGTCCILSCHIANKQVAAAMGLYTMSEKAFDEFKEKTKELYGERKAEKVSEAVIDDHLTKKPSGNQQIIFASASGRYRCYETWTRQYFISDIESLRRLDNDINDDLNGDTFGYISLKEVYDRMGVPFDDIVDESTGEVIYSCAEDLGFNNFSGGIHRPHFKYSTHLAEDGVPCLAVTFVNKPIANYWKY